MNPILLRWKVRHLRFQFQHFQNVGDLPGDIAVSYTHLDVYKRQLPPFYIWHTVEDASVPVQNSDVYKRQADRSAAAILCDPALIEQAALKETSPVSYTHLTQPPAQV